MLSNCNSESVWGGLTSTPITEKLPNIGSSLDPRFPEIPVTTTTGLAISFSAEPATPELAHYYWQNPALAVPLAAFPAVDAASAVEVSDLFHRAQSMPHS